MMPKATDPTVPANRDAILAAHDEAEAILDEAATLAPSERLAARLAVLELDAETLEMIMAALTAEVCDQINVSDA